MEGEIQSKPPQENGAKVEEKAEEVKALEKEDIKTAKTKTPPATRSRSRTPQIAKDDEPKLKKEEKRPNMKKIEEETSNHSHSERKSRRSDKQEKKEKETKEVVVLVETDKQADDGAKSNESPEVVEAVEAKEAKRTSPRKRDKPEEAKNKQPESETVEAEVEATTPCKNEAAPRADGEDMEPLVLATDEPDPELQFDEASDPESGGGSPVLVRCKTRRSHTRNIPTPKTPKPADSDPDKCSKPQIEHADGESTRTENLNDTNDSLGIGDISTRVEVGSDVTRLNYILDNESVVGDDQEYLDSIREKSLRDTLRGLSPRRPIRSSGADSYRVRALRNNQSKSRFSTNNSDDRPVYLTATKRKRSISPDHAKRFKSGELPTSGFLSSTFRGWFLAEPTSSTPKLTAYKDESKDIHEEIKDTDGDNSNKKGAGCSVM
ncbi:hypothetical protein GWI33_012687 [Rhynchophorus ferrugineus]|uniref:Uncharacterized protein n=1 Tax=Rhynchophorus ferrugineus TaxID=354439 RepID=A0A834I8I3_RHYFE|nr:hypothetical protein GWI33_012687 [Rhynchophorus ferrugineus]